MPFLFKDIGRSSPQIIKVSVGNGWTIVSCACIIDASDVFKVKFQPCLYVSKRVNYKFLASFTQKHRVVFYFK